MRRHDPVYRDQGFSIVELVIAMTVTLIITGAVFQLVTAGNTAFRREPAIADRQQNIRVAMDLIYQDVYRAGYSLPDFAQAFTDNLNGVGPLGSGGAATDVLEIFSAADCPYLSVCDISGNGTGASVTTRQVASDCYQFPTLVIFGGSQNDAARAHDWGLYLAEKPGPGVNNACKGGSQGTGNGHFTVPHGKKGEDGVLYNPPGGLQNWVPEWMMVGQAIRYRIALDGQRTPNLERSAYGGRQDGNGNSTWQIIARGVEDLQVQYLNGTGWHDTPGTNSCGVELSCNPPVQSDYDTIIRRVRVRLSARAMEANLQGQTTSSLASTDPGRNAVRGQLVTEAAPRAAALTLGNQRGEL